MPPIQPRGVLSHGAVHAPNEAPAATATGMSHCKHHMPIIRGILREYGPFRAHNYA